MPQHLLGLGPPEAGRGGVLDHPVAQRGEGEPDHARVVHAGAAGLALGIGAVPQQALASAK
jgi:hypothetical protein